MTDIIERSKKAQEDIDQLVNQNEFLKHMCRWQEKEIVRLQNALRQIADADAYDENVKPNGGGYFINLARAVLGEEAR